MPRNEGAGALGTPKDPAVLKILCDSQIKISRSDLLSRPPCADIILRLILFCPFNCQRTAKAASGKGPRQKTPKIGKKCQTCFETFRHFSRRAKNVNNRQEVSKIFSTIFDNFRAAPVFRHLLGGSEIRNFPVCYPEGPKTQQEILAGSLEKKAPMQEKHSCLKCSFLV